MEFCLALQFLTRIPVKIRHAVEEKNLARAMAYFPLIGLLLGGCAAGIHKASSMVLVAPVCDWIAIAFLVIITGNLHGDGLMDTADGLFSGRPRLGMLEIMKDSRIGSHGATAGFLILLAKFVLLGQIPLAAKSIALVLAPALGRWAQVYSAFIYPYARSEGGTGSFTDQVGIREVFWASLTILLVVIPWLGLKSSILLGAVFVSTAGLGWYISRKIGGMTGDTLGAMNECIEVVALIILQMLLRGR